MLPADLLAPLYHSTHLPPNQTELSLSSCYYLSSLPLSARLGWYLQDKRVLYTCILLIGTLVKRIKRVAASLWHSKGINGMLDSETTFASCVATNFQSSCGLYQERNK